MTAVDTTAPALTMCCGRVRWRGLRCTGCGHRQDINGVPPKQTRELALRRPWVVVTELAGRARARRAGRGEYL